MTFSRFQHWSFRFPTPQGRTPDTHTPVRVAGVVSFAPSSKTTPSLPWSTGRCTAAEIADLAPLIYVHVFRGAKRPFLELDDDLLSTGRCTAAEKSPRRLEAPKLHDPIAMRLKLLLHSMEN